MGVFKNKVGRPSNEVKKKRKILVLSIIAVCVVLIYALSTQVNKTLVKDNKKRTTKDIYIREKTQAEKDVEEYVKDFKASEEFYEKYHNDYKIMRDMNNLEYALIVISKDGISNNFGATYIVAAPDYTYFLQYNNKEEQNNAYNEFKKLKEEGKIFSVNFNSKIVPFEDSEETKYLKIWPTTVMGFDKANEYFSNNHTDNNVKIGIIDHFPIKDPEYAKFYKEKINQDRVINTYYNTSMYHKKDHGIMVASTIDRVLSPIFGFEQYELEYGTDFINQLDLLSETPGVYVINCSFGLGGNYRTEEVFAEEYNAINRALERNTIVIAAAGNDANDQLNYPSAYSNVISVSSVNIDYKHENSIASTVDFVAPDYSNCETYKGLARCYGTSFSSPLVVSAVALMKYYDPEISLENVKKLLSLYAITSIPDFKLGENGWGNGLVYVGATKIFDDVRNKDYESGPLEGTIPDLIEYERQKEKEDAKFFNRLKREFKEAIDFYKEWFREIFSGKFFLSSCNKSSDDEVKTTSTITTVKSPKNLVSSSSYYLISNYKNIQDMKKQKDYGCDESSDCYAKAYQMRLTGKLPVKYYAHCNKENTEKTKLQCKTGKKYTCNTLCPNPNLKNGDLVDAYNNVVKNKPSIITLTNGNETHDVVIVGIKNNAYQEYGDNLSKNSNITLDAFVVIDVWDGKLKTINANSNDNDKNIKGIKLGWKSDNQVRY